MRQHYSGYVQWGFPDFFRRWLSPQPRRVLVFREGGAQASLDVGDDLLRIHLRLVLWYVAIVPFMAALRSLLSYLSLLSLL